MDNFFEILIYIFIIVSFVNSFLKKKKKKEEKDKADAAQKAQTVSSQPVFGEKKQEPSGKDIFEEIQNLFNPPTSKLPKEEPQQGFEDLWKTESETDHYKETVYHEPIKSEHEVTMSEHTATFSEHSPSREMHSSKKVEMPEENVVESLMGNDHQMKCSNMKINSFVTILRNEFNEKDLLKKYVIISEILGKPKALRR